MAEDEKKAPEPEADEDREAILRRRSRFVAAALAGIAGASLIAACSTKTGSSRDASPAACLTPSCDEACQDAYPQPCLTPIPPDGGDAGDASGDSGDASRDASDAQPQPCLSPLPPDAGDGGDGG